MKKTISMLCLVALTVGCKDHLFGVALDDTGGEEDGTTALPPDDVDAIFQATCALSGCHDASSASQGVNLETDPCGTTVGVGSLYGGEIITANDSASSVLWLKMDGADNVGGVMPISGRLSDAEIQTVADWIDAGATCSE